MVPHDESRAIAVSLPAATEFASTLRVLAASLGADLGFTMDEIDDLRLALNEVFTSVADAGGPRVRVVFVPRDATIEVEMTIEPDAPIELDELATTILASVVDDVAVSERRATFTKRARESAAT